MRPANGSPSVVPALRARRVWRSSSAVGSGRRHALRPHRSRGDELVAVPAALDAGSGRAGAGDLIRVVLVRALALLDTARDVPVARAVHAGRETVGRRAASALARPHARAVGVAQLAAPPGGPARW